MRHDWLNPGERYGRALCSTECLLNLTNSQDIALKLYPLRHILSGQALGDVGFTHRDRKVLRGWSRKVRDADVSAGLGHRHRWPNYTSKRHLAWFIRNYAFYADQPPVVLPPQARPDDIGSRLAEHALPGPGLSGS